MAVSRHVVEDERVVVVGLRPEAAGIAPAMVAI